MSDEATTTGKSYLTPFNVVAGIIVIIGLIVTALRFTQGLGAVTNLSDYNRHTTESTGSQLGCRCNSEIFSHAELMKRSG